MRFANRAICVGGLGFAVTCLAACGSGGSLLSANQASELKSQLAQVSQSLSAHQCAQALNEITNFRSTIDGLGSVNQTLVSNLDQGASKINQLASRDCRAPVTHHTTTTTATTPPITTTTTATTTTPTNTSTTTTPTNTNTTPAGTGTTTTPSGPGSGGVGLGNGNGNGNGNGGGGGD